MTSSIEIADLTTQFGKIKVVNHVSLDVQCGDGFRFLGSNAIGQSAPVKIATTLLVPAKGTSIGEGKCVVFELENPETKNPQIIRAVMEAERNVVEVSKRVPNLEAVYLKIIGGN